MLNELARITLKLLQFRAGPQDFPYSSQLTRPVVVAALLVSYVQYQLTLPPLVAAVHSVVTLAVIAGLTWQMLAWRKLANRAQQAINSLFATGTALTVLLLPVLAAIAPQMVRLAENPDRVATEPLPALPMLAVMALSFWSLAVSANIYRHALNVHPVMGVAVALLAALVSVSVAGSVSGLFLN